jgi:hypothetical protein
MNQVQRSVDYYAVCNSAEQRLSTHKLGTLLGDPCGLWRGHPYNRPHLPLHEQPEPPEVIGETLQ